MAEQNEKERKERARRLRDQIEDLTESKDPKNSETWGEGLSSAPSNPRDFIRQRMKDLDKSDDEEEI
jgi:hypothetical protein